MKRFALAGLVVAVVALFSLGNVAKACSNQALSAEKTVVRMATDPHSPRAIMIVVAKDEAGETLCQMDQMDFGTSRNMYAPGNYWPVNVDDITVYTKGGVALVVFKTKRPAGTTVYAQANYTKIGNTDGMPFCYTGTHFWNE